MQKFSHDKKTLLCKLFFGSYIKQGTHNNHGRTKMVNGIRGRNCVTGPIFFFRESFPSVRSYVEYVWNVTRNYWLRYYYVFYFGKL